MPDFRSTLIGDWTLARTVTDGHAMTGAAKFIERPDGSLYYREQGLLSLPDSGGGRLQFSRAYLYYFAGAALTVLFDEATPRLFEDVEISGEVGDWHGNGQHLCDRDLYISGYAFQVSSGFRTSHRVDGPRKSYVIETQYIRL